MRRWALGLVALAALCLQAGCREMLTSPEDFADYRAFRMAAAPGTRLGRAQHYLDRHPEGAFATEVRRAFEREEPRYFARAQSSRQTALDYLVDLPHGPHADAAAALLRALDTSMEDAELTDLVRTSRASGARLDALALRRKLVGQTLAKAVDAVLDPRLMGAKVDALPEPSRALILGPAPGTWGSTSLAREEDLFFDLPTRPVRASRVVTLSYRLVAHDGVITEARIEGPDLFVHLTEADERVALDPTNEGDRRAARVHAQGRLGPLLDAHVPVDRCPELSQGNALFHRCCAPAGIDPKTVRAGECAGVAVLVRAGKGPGQADAIVVRGASTPTASPPREEAGRP